MASHVSAIERLAERPIAVEPAAIEDEFTRIWRETSGAGHDESSVRLRVLNFVAIGRADAAERFDAVMQRLPRHHPCRALLATTADGLVVAHAGVQVSDAEVLAAAASQGELTGHLPGSGAIRVLHGSDLALIVLLENEAPEDAIDAMLAEQLTLLEQALAA